MIWNSLKDFSITMQLYHSLFPSPPSTSSFLPLLALFRIRGFFLHWCTDCCHVHVCVFSFILKFLFILDTSHSFPSLLSSRSPPIYLSPYPFHSSERVRLPPGVSAKPGTLSLGKTKLFPTASKLCKTFTIGMGSQSRAHAPGIALGLNFRGPLKQTKLNNCCPYTYIFLKV